jgi:hypothetical protein
LQSGVLGKEV